MAEQNEGKAVDRTEARLDRDWTKGSVLRNLFSLSWPMLIMEGLFASSQIVDMIWIGKLGPAAIAGVGVANIVVMLVMTMDIGLVIGVQAMVARHVGAKDMGAANHIAGHGFILCVLWGSFLTGAGVIFAEPIMAVFRVEPEIMAEGATYLRTIFAGWIPLEILVMSLYVVQSSGDTLTPMKIELFIRSVHVSLCPFLVLGLWVFPRLGVTGAAMSNVISQMIGAVIGLWILFGGHTRLRLSVSGFRFDPRTIVRILKIGVPALVAILQRPLGDMILIWLIVPFGTLAVAAHSLVGRVDMLIFMPGIALGAGAGVLVGQNLGAGRVERAQSSAWLAVWFVQVFLMICSAALLLWAEQIMGVFTKEAELIRLGSLFLRIATGGYLVLAFVLVLQSCIAGSGDTVPNMIVSVAAVWVIQLPLAYILSHVTELGVLGVRWAVVAGTFAAAVIFLVYFSLGRWKVKKI